MQRRQNHEHRSFAFPPRSAPSPADNDEVTAEGKTVADVIDDLEKKHPGIRDRLLDEKGVRRFVNIYVGEEDIRFLDGLKTELQARRRGLDRAGHRGGRVSDRLRYARQMLLPEIGEEGQETLGASVAATRRAWARPRDRRGAMPRAPASQRSSPASSTRSSLDALRFLTSPAARAVVRVRGRRSRAIRHGSPVDVPPRSSTDETSLSYAAVCSPRSPTRSGNTPLVRLERIGKSAPSVEIYAKLEFANPGGSVKDRPALRMMHDAIADGRLGPGKTLIDSTSGNTGVAYSLFGAALGYPVELVMPSNVSKARKDIAQAFGTKIVYSDPMEGSDGAIRVVHQMVEQSPERYFYPDQYANPRNPRAHYHGTGREILDAVGDRITHFVTGLGTTGTMMGTTRRLKEHTRPIRCIAAQPADALHGLEGLKHLPSSHRAGDLRRGYPRRDDVDEHRGRLEHGRSARARRGAARRSLVGRQRVRRGEDRREAAPRTGGRMRGRRSSAIAAIATFRR